jgi:hypothetical protein
MWAIDSPAKAASRFWMVGDWVFCMVGSWRVVCDVNQYVGNVRDHQYIDPTDNLNMID